MRPRAKLPTRVTVRGHSTLSPLRLSDDHESYPPPADQQEPTSLRMRQRLLGDLREAGLSDREARAEAARLLAGDVWSG
ncbi:hypothetical protein [Sinomonas gamaensis]|jgi:hypothetical protein|uniref:hypothetical protein n=1 Tax=Sinomonas gamaensis TaxID=2565624 RepID=UPI0014866352|nr:hypothetical protein [Sinomonas gamaensis]